ncbi:YciI family protein [Nonomuraea sp. NPDC050540]|uniref:YciI family protein n=1 Tax=Nonomuraea sp. NPDC050540 TaxID=3364367 RepID=UPI0037AA0C2C
MKYALLLYGNAADWASATPEQIQEGIARHGAYIEMLKGRGAYLEGEELGAPGEAVCLRRGEGAVLRTDGPFVETVEHLGGYYLIEAKDLDEAIELATACPERTVEVRPVVEYSG